MGLGIHRYNFVIRVLLASYLRATSTFNTRFALLFILSNFFLRSTLSFFLSFFFISFGSSHSTGSVFVYLRTVVARRLLQGWNEVNAGYARSFQSLVRSRFFSGSFVLLPDKIRRYRPRALLLGSLDSARYCLLIRNRRG